LLNKRDNRLLPAVVRAAATAIMSGAIFLSGCSLLPSEEEPLKPPLVKPAQAKIVTVEPKVGTLEKKVSGGGIFESVHTRYHRYTTSGGRVAEVLARSGDTVKAGDPLLRLETGNLDMTLLQRKLEVEKKLLALDEAKAAGNERRIRIASMELELAQMSLEDVESVYVNKELKALMDGVVIFSADLEPGDLIQEYQTLFTVADPKQLRLAFETTADLSQVKVGMKAEIQFKDKVYEGKVVQTPGSAPYEEDERLRERYARTLFLALETMPDEVKIGDMAVVNIITDRREDVLILPKNAVRKLFGRTFVQVLEGESRREFDIETGLETNTEVEIVDGLELGQQVILQ